MLTRIRTLAHTPLLVDSLLLAAFLLTCSVLFR